MDVSFLQIFLARCNCSTRRAERGTKRLLRWLEGSGKRTLRQKSAKTYTVQAARLEKRCRTNSQRGAVLGSSPKEARAALRSEMEFGFSLASGKRSTRTLHMVGMCFSVLFFFLFHMRNRHAVTDPLRRGVRLLSGSRVARGEGVSSDMETSSPMAEAGRSWSWCIDRFWLRQKSKMIQ